MERLQRLPHLVGQRQSEKAICRGDAVQAYLAEDTEPMLAERFAELCAMHEVPLMRVSDGKVLAKACRVEVSTACAVLLNPAKTSH